MTDIGGLVVPTAVLDRGAAEQALEHARELVGLLVQNVRELSQFVKAPVQGEGQPRRQPLRAVDNSFRHGFRVLLRGSGAARTSDRP